MSTQRLSQEEFLRRCIKVHGDKFDYSKAVYQNSYAKVQIRCNLCQNSWMVAPVSLVGRNQSGCPVCRRTRASIQFKKTTDQIIEEIKAKHGDKFLYDKIVYKNSNTKITLGCRIHGDFEKWPNDIKHGSGCPKCSGNVVDINEFMQSMTIKHDKFDFSLFEYLGAKTPSTVKCQHHGEFLVTPNRLRNSLPNRGCAKCGPSNQIETSVIRGHIRDPKDIPEYELYRKQVWKISNQQYKKFEDKINPNKFQRGKHYHLDHKFSIQQGWNKKIPPEIIGGWKNLQIISASENCKKSNKNSVTLESIL